MGDREKMRVQAGATLRYDKLTAPEKCPVCKKRYMTRTRGEKPGHFRYKHFEKFKGRNAVSGDVYFAGKTSYCEELPK